MNDFRILFVSRGNICRSPVAEGLLRGKLERVLRPAAGMISVESAGISAQPGASMHPYAAAELERLGGDPSDFRARRRTRGMAEGADLVLTATKELRSRTLEEAPRALRRAFTILGFASMVTSFELTARCGARMDDLEKFVGAAAALRSRVAPGGADVPDPFGNPLAVHRHAADVIDASLGSIADALATAMGCVAVGTAS